MLAPVERSILVFDLINSDITFSYNRDELQLSHKQALADKNVTLYYKIIDGFHL
jgi:hypothetical protein